MPGMKHGALKAIPNSPPHSHNSQINMPPNKAAVILSEVRRRRTQSKDLHFPRLPSTLFPIRLPLTHDHLSNLDEYNEWHLGGNVQGPAKLGFAIGLVIFCVGGLARVYMDFTANGIRMAYDFRRGNTESSYWKLIKERGAPAWPFFLSVVLIPLGIAVVFGSIIWSNHQRH